VPRRSEPAEGEAADDGPVSPDAPESEHSDIDVLEPEIVEGIEWDLDEAATATRDDAVAVAEGEVAAGGEETIAALPLPSQHDRATALVPRDALGAYLAQLRQYPLLSREEEHDLAVQYFEHGDLDAAYKLITSNLRLVVMIAREYQRAFHNLLDLVQEGNVGLLEAVRNFDPYRGVRLPSYAVWWIRAYIIRYVMNNFRLVKVGTTQAQRRLFFNLQKEKARLEAKGFTATPKLIARNLGVKEKEVVEMDMRMGASEVSVDAPVQGDGDTPVIELMASPGQGTAEDAVANKEFYDLMRLKLDEFGRTLTGRDREIFEDRLLSDEPVTLQEIGERWGVSRERVRQIEEALKKRLREFLVAQVREVPDVF
jgi:RNA polymerase sigma-32 factor